MVVQVALLDIENLKRLGLRHRIMRHIGVLHHLIQSLLIRILRALLAAGWSYI